MWWPAPGCLQRAQLNLLPAANPIRRRHRRPLLFSFLALAQAQAQSRWQLYCLQLLLLLELLW